MAAIRTAVMAMCIVAACGGERAAPPATTTRVSVRVIGHRSGLECAGTAPIGGTRSQLTARDEHGTVIGTAEFAPTLGLESCDWTAAVDLVNTPDFVTLEGNSGPLATLSRSDYADGTVTLRGDEGGHISAVD